ncbi:MAG: hypothetical protein N2578_07920, partial [Bdellovibrionaceae bacterium]|nr:hypothetical protein [Pseudobdellovibrionaceae bacterium]
PKLTNGILTQSHMKKGKKENKKHLGVIADKAPVSHQRKFPMTWSKCFNSILISNPDFKWLRSVYGLYDP